MNRSLVLRAAVVSGLLGTAVSIGGGWGAMQPMGLVAGGIVGYSVSRISDAIFDGLLAGAAGGVLGLVLGIAVRYVGLLVRGGNAADAGQWGVYYTISGLLFVPGTYAVGALVAAPLVCYLKPHVRQILDRRTA